MNNYLFALTIGPVQSFIAQARKTQDLYAGSQILSDLIGFAMNEVNASFGEKAELIFPYQEAESKPNRFLAQINDCDDIQAFGNRLRLKIKSHLLEMAARVFSDDSFKMGEAQLDDLLEIYWAAEPMQDNYADTVLKLEQKLGAVKNARDFVQFTEQGRKCTVNGFYNALYHRPILKKEAPAYFNGTSKLHFNMSEVGPGEAISAITLLKRLYNKGDGDGFISVSHIAQMHLWNHNGLISEGDNLLAIMGAQSWEGINAQILYSENLEKNYFEEQGINADLNLVKDAVFKFSNTCKELKLPKLKYYAVLMFDADNMGEHLKKCKNKNEHTALSKSLSEFAKKTKQIIDSKNYGRTIYAGGDDYLGLLNMFTLFDALTELRQAFDDSLGKQYGMTFSAGLSIAHYRTPLGYVLEQVRAAEKSAKAFSEDKNAIAFTVIKHSGEILRSVLPWKTNVQGQWSTNLLNVIYDYFKQGVSPAYIKNLSEEMTIWHTNAVKFQPIADYEIARLIKRASGGKVYSDLINSVKSLYELPLVYSNRQETFNFEHSLLMLDFMNRKMN